MKLNLKLTDLTKLLAISSLVAANALASPSGGYVLSLGEPKIITNKNDPRVEIALVCEEGFQAENIFMIFCSSGATAEDLSASVHVSIPNIFTTGDEASLTIFNGKTEESFTLRCNPGPDQNAAQNNAHCE